MRIVLVTAPPKKAAALARALVEERLAACVNLLPGVTSVYRWEGEVQEDGETLLVVKTTAAAIARLTARILELHPYEVPEVIALPLEPGEGNEAYLRWLAGSVD